MSEGTAAVAPPAATTPSVSVSTSAVTATTPSGATAIVNNPPAAPTAITPSSTPQKERHSLTLDQRRALRRWANAQLSRPSHKQCIEWFQHEYHQTISQSTVSHSLSPKYARLDGEPQLSGSRLRFGNWPEVEKLVLLWYQQMVHAGRHPTNEELADKAKSIFSQLPRHRGEEPPEFSPGWIHRFKKRYGLLIRRQRRSSTGLGLGLGGGAVGGLVDQLAAGVPGAATAVMSDDPANDIVYLVDTVPRLMTVTPDTNPVAIRETIQRVLGVEPSVDICTRVRDEIVRYDPELARQSGGPISPATPTTAAAAAAASLAAAQQHTPGVLGTPGLSGPTPVSQASAASAAAAAVAAAAAAAASAARSQQVAVAAGDAQGPNSNGNGGAGDISQPTATAPYPHADDDPEMVLQNALRQLQQEEVEAAEAEAAAAAQATGARAEGQLQTKDVTMTPIVTGGPGSVSVGAGTGSSSVSPQAEKPLRCPFCVNQRMLRTIKEAVEHMSTHVVV